MNDPACECPPPPETGGFDVRGLGGRSALHVAVGLHMTSLAELLVQK